VTKPISQPPQILFGEIPNYKIKGVDRYYSWLENVKIGTYNKGFVIGILIYQFKYKNHIN
jgi:hypothetical protein